jgi:hypothetical protein
MCDKFNYESPLGWLGRIADGLFLEAYMRRFLLERNLLIKYGRYCVRSNFFSLSLRDSTSTSSARIAAAWERDRISTGLAHL